MARQPPGRGRTLERVPISPPKTCQMPGCTEPNGGTPITLHVNLDDDPISFGCARCARGAGTALVWRAAMAGPHLWP